MATRWNQGAPRDAQAETKLKLLDTLERLACEVDRVRADQGFNALLRGISKLWHYSILNHLLIVFQFPEATSVHGARQWERLGRTIKPGTEGIVITAPSGSRGKFIWVEVYDVAQTDGPPIPEQAMKKGECQHLEAIELAAGNLGVELRNLELCSPVVSAGGIPAKIMGQSAGGVISVRANLTPLTRAHVIVHELAHELLHQEQFLEQRSYKKQPRKPVQPPHEIAEAEADATAFVVMDALGYEIGTATYLAWMGAESVMIYRSTIRIHAAAAGILRAVEGSKKKPRLPWWGRG